MKKIIIVICVAMLMAGVCAWRGWYPVARVEGVLISARTWNTLIRASQQYADMELTQYGKQPIDFNAPENRAMLDQGKKDVLTSLIEDDIVTKEGVVLVPDFASKTERKTTEALQHNPAIADNVENLYGLSLDDFKSLVLVPQARRDVIQEELASTDGPSLDQWLRTAKRNADVRLFFVPFHWNGERVE